MAQPMSAQHSARRRRAVTGREEAMAAVAFSPGRRTLATDSDDQTAIPAISARSMLFVTTRSSVRVRLPDAASPATSESATYPACPTKRPARTNRDARPRKLRHTTFRTSRRSLSRPAAARSARWPGPAGATPARSRSPVVRGPGGGYPPAGYPAPHDREFAGGRREDRGEQPDGRGLAGAVGAQQPHH